jgi:uncharacterized protein
MKIRLNEIPEEGRDYLFDRQSGELTENLSDLIGDHAYEVKMFIKPVGTAYQMNGRVHSTFNEVCSKCGYDFELPITKDFREFIINEKDTDHRKSQSVHGNQSVDFLDDKLSMTTVSGNIFDPGEYAHESLALAEPLYPTCGQGGTCLHQEEADAILRQMESEFEKADQTVRKAANPFSALQELQVSKKN